MAEYKITLDRADVPKGEEFDIPPVGRIKNGSSITVELEKEDADKLKDAFGVTVKSASHVQAAKSGGGDKE